MSISFSCPHCQSKMTVPDTLAGKRGKCSKCKNIVNVPGGENAAPPRPVPATAGAARPAPPPPPPRTPATPPPDLDEEAAKLLADEPKEEDKQAELIEFNCPQCDEPVQLALEHAGKRHPCPHCRKIIPVPVPQSKKKADWRDTGPKLPTGAKREELPALEGAWGTAGKTGPSAEALKEAGVIKEKEKPKTRLQKIAPYALFLVPLLLLGGGGWWLWSAIGRNKEKRAFDSALNYARSGKAADKVGADGEAALFAQLSRYYLRQGKAESAAGAREQLSNAISRAQRLKSPSRELLIVDLIPLLVELGGDREAIEAGTRLKWDEVQKLIGSALAVVANHETAQRDALRAACVALAAKGQTQRLLPLASQVARGEGLPPHEANALVGLELLRLGQADNAKLAAAEAERPYTAKGKRPTLRPAVVALAVALGRKPPEPAKETFDREAHAIGEADGYARLGKLQEARRAVAKIDDPRGQLRARIALAAGVIETKSGDGAEVVNEAINSLKAVTVREGLEWECLQLVELGLAAGLGGDALGPALERLSGPELAWARLQVLRATLRQSKQVEAMSLAEAVTADTMAGKLARLELARHNTRQDAAWAGTVADWPEGQQAFGQLGVALGLQRDK